MLVNVKFFKKTFLISFFLLITTSLLANEKDQIVAQLNKLNSLEFTFDQLINEKAEKGNCLLEFPGKLKCNYFDDKEKELSNPFSGYNLEKGEIKPNKKSEENTIKKDLKQKKKQAKSDLKFYKKTGIDLSEDESPVNFLGQVGLMGAAKGIAQGIKNRDEYGGGLKGAAKATIGNFTGQTEKQRFDDINEKLDSISQAVGVSQDQTEPIDNTIETGQDQDQVEAQSPMMMKSMKKKVLAKTGTGKAHNMSAAQYRQEGLMSRLSGNDERLSTQELSAVENLDFINDMSPMNKYNCKK